MAAGFRSPGSPALSLPSRNAPRHAPRWIFTSHVWLGTLKFTQRKLDEKSRVSVPLVTLQALRSHRRLLTAPRESMDRDDFPHDGTFSRTARQDGALSLTRRLHRLPPGANPFSCASWVLLTSGSWGNSETYVKVITSTLAPPPPRSPPWQCRPFHPLPAAHPQPRPVCPSSLCFWECGAPVVIHSHAASHLDDWVGDSPFRATSLEGPQEVEIPDGRPQPHAVPPPVACSALPRDSSPQPRPSWPESCWLLGYSLWWPLGLQYDCAAGEKDPEPFLKTPSSLK